MTTVRLPAPQLSAVPVMEQLIVPIGGIPPFVTVNGPAGNILRGRAMYRLGSHYHCQKCSSGDAGIGNRDRPIEGIAQCDTVTDIIGLRHDQVSQGTKDSYAVRIRCHPPAEAEAVLVTEPAIKSASVTV